MSQANDLLTAHPDMKAIYGMYDEAGTGAAKALQTRGLVGKIALATADGSPTTIKLLRDGAIQGIFLQEAVGQGIDATQQVYNALTGKPVEKDIPLAEPLATTEISIHRIPRRSSSGSTRPPPATTEHGLVTKKIEDRHGRRTVSDHRPPSPSL